MPNDNTIVPLRAKSGYLEVTTIDKGGRAHKAKSDIVSGTGGVLSAKEMEKTMIEVAKERGLPEDSVRVETYAPGTAPSEVNPRHRGSGYNFNKRVSEPTEYNPKPKSYNRKVWGGWSPPEQTSDADSTRGQEE